MVLQVFFLHFYKIVETLSLLWLFDSKNHFSHFLTFELIKTTPVLLDHRVPRHIVVLRFLSRVIENACDQPSPHLALALNISLRLHIVLVLLLLLFLHVLGLRLLLELRISLSSVAHTLRELSLLIEILRSLALRCGSLSLLNLLGLRSVSVLLIVNRQYGIILLFLSHLLIS